MTALENPDTQLVRASRAGDRDAFTQIVTRYQSLVCSVAYSGTGSLSLSEDVAQDTFVAAWKQLGELREPEKLRAWLCGIARNITRATLRRLGREPVQSAENLEAADEIPAPEKSPADHTISREEEAILWRSLERIPEIYREPLVLFYREGQSVAQTAELLVLSEDAVKQRLSRGRNLLAGEVTGMIEKALKVSAPGRAFSLGVLAALPVVLTTSAKAATIGAAAAKGTMVAKTAASVGLLNAIVGPVVGLLGPWLQYRVFLKAAKSDEERGLIVRYYRKLFTHVLGFGVVLSALIILSRNHVQAYPTMFVCALVALVSAYVVAAIRMGASANRMFRHLRANQERLASGTVEKQGWEYRSRHELLGLPLVHFRFDNSASRRPPVKAWIAGGDFAYGMLFALGAFAIAPVSLGGAAIGLVSFGGLSLGLFSIGGFALGGWVFGGFAVGWKAFGGCALAWQAAVGGLAIARDIAVGGVAHAAQANNEIAQQFTGTNPFFRNMEILSRYIAWVNLLWLIPVAAWLRLNQRTDQNRARD